MKSKRRKEFIKIPSEIEKVALQLKKNHNYIIKENTKLYVANQINQAIEKKVISSDERGIAAAALMTTGVQGARLYGKRHVQTRDIQKVWREVKMGPGNCPPNECLFKTVIARKTEFGNDFPLFNELTTE